MTTLYLRAGASRTHDEALRWPWAGVGAARNGTVMSPPWPKPVATQPILNNEEGADS